MKKRVLLITGGNCGGAERMTLLYGKILEKAGYDILLIVCINSKRPNYSLEPFIPKNWRLFVVSCRFRSLFFHLFKTVRKLSADVIFCSMPVLNLIILSLKFIGAYRGKVIVRSYNLPSVMNNKRNALIKFFYRFADGIIAQTKEMKAEMMDYYHLKDNQIMVINNPIDKYLIKAMIHEEFPFDHHYTNYVAVGRVARQKDYTTLIQAFKIVHSCNKKSRLYIVGTHDDITLFRELNELARGANLDDSLFFEGFQPNPYKYMDGADVFCLSSIFEGLPNVMIEAMYLGKPVVATKCIPYIAQVINDGQNGYTVKVGDSESFAEAMIRAAEMRDLPKYVDLNQTEDLIINMFRTA